MQVNNMSQALKIQGAIGVIAIVLFAIQGSLLAAAYGFMIGIVNVVMLGSAFNKANQKAKDDPKSGIQVLYLSAVIRFILLAVLFVLGLQAFGLEPMPVVLTFVAMQVGQVFNLKGKQRLTD